MRVLVTGADGFAGSHLLEALLPAKNGAAESSDSDKAANVELLEIAATAAPDGGWREGALANNRSVRAVPLDLTDAKAVEALVAQTQPEHIYHFAENAFDRDRDAMYAMNVTGTRNLLEAAAQMSPFPRTLLISSGAVYGNTDPQRPAREEDPIGPLWRFGAYTDSKIEMETVAKAYRAFAIVARPFAYTGPGQVEAELFSFYARQVARIERGLESPELRVNGLEAQRDLLDVRDVARACLLLMREGKAGDAYNIATSKPLALRQILETLLRLSRKHIRLEPQSGELGVSDIVCASGDTLRLWAATGWSPRYMLEETLSDLLSYWRQVAL